MRPGHADVVEHADLEPEPLGSLASLFGHGSIAGPRRDNGHAADWFRGGVVERNAIGAGDGVVSPVRKLLGQGRGLFGVDARGQHALAAREQGGKDFFEGRERFARPVDDLGEATAAAAIEIDLRLADVGDAG